MTDQKKEKLLLLQETLEDLLTETLPYSQEWRSLLQSGFVLAEGYTLIKPDIAAGFYNNIIVACSDCQSTQEGYAVLSRAYNGLANVPKKGLEEHFGLS